MNEQLRDDQVKAMLDENNDLIKQLRNDILPMKNVINYESIDNADEEYIPIDESENYSKEMDISINPNTGERVIIGGKSSGIKSALNDAIKLGDLDSIVNTIDESENIFNTNQPIDESDVIEYIDSDTKPALLEEDLSEEDLTKILNISNRLINKEQFSLYKELPDSIKKIVDDFIVNTGMKTQMNSVSVLNRCRNEIAHSLFDEFISNIQVNRAKSDFAKELEALYTQASDDMAKSSVEFMAERNKAYREAADKIEDPKKKETLLAILDRIDEACNLTELKVFAKKCKIKPIELEKPENKVYSRFLLKYKNSNNNIYDISLARKALARNILDENKYMIADIDRFLIAFCKQVSNYDVENPLDHAYMYYVIYNCAIMDGYADDRFKNNVLEVINILKMR